MPLLQGFQQPARIRVRTEGSHAQRVARACGIQLCIQLAQRRRACRQRLHPQAQRMFGGRPGLGRIPIRRGMLGVGPEHRRKRHGRAR